MIFCYKCANGHTFEKWYRCGEAPESVKCDGCGENSERDWQAEGHGMNEAALKFDRKYPYTSSQLYKTPAASECPTEKVTVGNKRKRTVDMPVVTSKRHEQYLMSKYNMQRD